MTMDPKDIGRGTLTPEVVKAAEELLERHYGEPVMTVSNYCFRLGEYNKALRDLVAENDIKKIAGGYQSFGPFHSNEELKKAQEGFSLVLQWAPKSNALARLLYLNEPLRTKKCPEHKGRWSGCMWPAPDCCSSGSDVTGWLKPDERTSVSNND